MENTNQAALIRQKKKELDLAESLLKLWASPYAPADEKAEKKERVEIIRRQLASLQQGTEGDPINLSDDEDDRDNEGAEVYAGQDPPQEDGNNVVHAQETANDAVGETVAVADVVGQDGNIIEEIEATVPEINTCAGCGAANRSLRRCGRCRSVHYCNRECQRGHWKIHRSSCSQI